MTDGYPVCRLGAVASVQGGFAFKSGDFIETGVPVLKIKNVRLREVDTTEPAYIDQSVAKDTARYFCKTGDLLISMTGSGPQAPNSVVGRVARFTGPSDRYLINQRVGRFVNKAPDKLDQRYLFYVLAQDETLWKLVSVATGSANQANISGSQIESLEVPLPPLAEQKAIAAVLGALDDKIELNRRMNATLETMARALFKSWFVDFDPVRAKLDGRPPAAPDPATAALFPGHLEDSPLGHIPKGWTCGTIGELGARILDKVANQSEWALEPLIDLSRMPQRSVALDEWGLGAELTTSVTRFIPKDILFGAIRPYFHKVGIAPVHGVTNVSVFVISGKQAFDWAFLAVLCSLDSTVEFATRVSKGTKMPVVGWPDFANYPVVVPPREIRRAFANVVAPLYDRIIANLHQSRTLATLRDTLLPKLLSGELSVAADKLLK